MTLLTYLMLVLVATVGILNGNPITGDQEAEVTSTARFVKVNPRTGRHRSLHKQDIENLGSGEIHNLRLFFDEEWNPLDMRLSQGSVWNKDSVIVIRRGAQRIKVPHGADHNCVLNGKLVEDGGLVTINRCGMMTGTIRTPNYNYRVEEYQEPEGNSSLSYTTFKVTRKIPDEQVIDDDYLQDATERIDQEVEIRMAENGHNATDTRRKRQVFVITIELAVHVDENFMNFLIREKGLDTGEKIRSWITEKWDQVQNVFSDPDKVGAHVTIQLKAIELWWNNPDGYPTNDVGLSDRMRWFCRNTPETDNFDAKVLYTKGVADHALGLAYTAGVCSSNRKCFLVRSPTEDPYIETHEFGHSIGFRHDPDIGGCGTPTGFMAWGMNLLYLPCYKRALKRILRYHDYDCLYQENVQESDIMTTTTTTNPPSTSWTWCT